jgi:hypothetical protein
MPPKAHQAMTDGKAHPTVEKAHQWKSSPHRGKSSVAHFCGAKCADKRFTEKAGESSRDAALGRWKGIINALDICAWCQSIKRLHLCILLPASALHNHAIASALAGSNKCILAG